MTAAPRVWVTRAEPGATRTAERVRALGFTPVVQPLLAVRFVDAALDLEGVTALAFTSRNGIEGFARLHPGRDLAVYAVGDATAEAARAAGFARVVSAEGYLEALASLIRETHPGLGGIVLHPVAARPAGDLPALVAGEIVMRSVVVYASEAITVTELPAFEIVLIHSPRAGERLAERVGNEAPPAQTAVAISRAAVAPVESLGFGRLLIADRPNEDAMMAALGKAVGRV